MKSELQEKQTNSENELYNNRSKKIRKKLTKKDNLTLRCEDPNEQNQEHR